MVTIDHRLRVWNLSSGRIAYTADLLGRDIDPTLPAKQLIHPSYSNLVRVITRSKGDQMCVSYSPLASGEFKIWQIMPDADEMLNLIDLCPNVALKPHAPTADVWTFADFAIVPNAGKIDGYKLWVLWKNNTAYQLETLEFGLDLDRQTRETWQNEWTSVARGSAAEMALPTLSSTDTADPTRKWMDYILQPGRYSKAVLETALSLYQASDKTSSKGKITGSLPQRLCSTIAKTATLMCDAEGHMNHDQFNISTDAFWRQYYRLVTDLRNAQGEALSLVLDTYSDMPWVICADNLAAVRKLSHIEQIWHNPKDKSSELHAVKALLTGGSNFRAAISDQMHSSFGSIISGELFEDRTNTIASQIQSIYDRCDFGNGISDEDYAQLLKDLGGDFRNVTSDIYDGILEGLTLFGEPDKKNHKLLLSEFGKHVLVQSVLEVVELHKNVCMDQLMLLVFIEAELSQAEDDIKVEATDVFQQFLEVLRRIEVVRWLASTQMPRNIAEDEGASSTMTVFEGILHHLLGLDTKPGSWTSAALTRLVIDLCSPESDYELTPSTIQCFLLQQGHADLALDLGLYTTDDAFARYVQGRAYLATGRPFEAAVAFKSAAFGLGKNSLHTAAITAC